LVVKKPPAGNKRFAARLAGYWSNRQLQLLGDRFKTEIGYPQDAMHIQVQFINLPRDRETDHIPHGAGQTGSKPSTLYSIFI